MERGGERGWKTANGERGGHVCALERGDNKHVWELAKGQSSWKWWQQWKGPFPELAKVAMRVFSQVTGAGAGERNWSTYVFVVSTLRSRLLPDRARRLVYVHYNLRTVNRVRAVDYEVLRVGRR